MLKETPKSLRTYFGVFAAFYVVMCAGALAQIIILFRDKPGAQLAPMFVVRTAFLLATAVAVVWVFVRFKTLIIRRPDVIRTILHLNFWANVVLGIANFVMGTMPNPIGLVLSILIYVYLLRSVGRISKELNSENAAEPISPAGATRG